MLGGILFGSWCVWYEFYSYDQIAAALDASDIEKAERLYSWGAKTAPIEEILGWKPIHWAVYFQNADWIQELVEQGADPNVRTKNGLNPLLMSEKPAVTSMLLTAGADPNARADQELDTPLIRACRFVATKRERRAMVIMLLQAGAEPNDREDSGSTALYYAVESQDEEAVRILTDAGADPNIQDSDGDSALHIAAMRRNIALCRVLLDAGGDWTLRNKKGVLATDIWKSKRFHGMINNRTAVKSTPE